MVTTKKQCMIIGASPLANGKIFDEFNPSDYFVICADGGYATAQKYNIKVDCTVGDFDSLGEVPTDKNVTVLPTEKDVTDTMYAVMLALKNGYEHFVLIGCLSGHREDHSIANYNVLLYLANKSVFAVMANEHTKVFVLKNCKLRVTKQKNSILSVFPFACSECNVSYSGLKYPMKNETLLAGGEIMGVSNEIISDEASVTIHNGNALVIIYTENNF